MSSYSINLIINAMNYIFIHNKYRIDRISSVGYKY